MDKFIKKLIILIFVAVLCMPATFAKDLMNTVGNINHEFSTSDLPEYVYLKNSKEIIAKNEIIIPKNSVLKLKTLCARKERRWHKSGYILTKLESFTSENSKKSYNIAEENIYLAVRKYEPVNKKEAAILATEIIVLSGASYYAPGVDILYFFTKGAIKREKHPNWFKAGVSNAYDNSIFWFWLKGKPIELEKDSQIKIKSVKEQKIEKLTSQINKYNEKQTFKEQKKQNKKLKKEIEKAIKESKNFDKDIEQEVKIFEKELSEENQTQNTEKELLKEEQNEKKQFKNSIKQYKNNKKELKKSIKYYKKAIKDTEPSNIKKAEKHCFKDLKKQVKQEKKEIKKILKIKKHIEERELSINTNS